METHYKLLAKALDGTQDWLPSVRLSRLVCLTYIPLRNRVSEHFAALRTGLETPIISEIPCDSDSALPL